MTKVYQKHPDDCLKPECAVQDLKGNHCPEKPTRQIDDGVWLCNKCYRIYKEKQKSNSKFSVVNF